MARIRSRDTKPELLLRRTLRELGYRGYRCHYDGVPGRPDVAFVRRRLAIFVDGAFWHGHPDYFTLGKSGPKWDAKILRNMARDREVNTRLFELGWSVVRFWDFEVLDDPIRAVNQLMPRLDSPKARQTASADPA